MSLENNPSITEKIDTDSPGGKLVFHVFAALAQSERGIIQERTKAGLVSARACERYGGRSRALSEEDVTLARSMLD